jgi:hypothetical protein
MAGRPPAQPPSGPPAPLSSFLLSLLPPTPSWLSAQLLPKLPIPARLPRTSGPWLSWPTCRCGREELLPPPPAHRPRLEPTRLPLLPCVQRSWARLRGPRGARVRARVRLLCSSAPGATSLLLCSSPQLLCNSSRSRPSISPVSPNSHIFPPAALICS